MQLKQGYKTTCRHIGFAKFACTQRAQIDQSDQIDQILGVDFELQAKGKFFLWSHKKVQCDRQKFPI